MLIDFSQLDYEFRAKPLLIGGMAMEYYGLRKAGDDIDLMVTKDDLSGLVKKYPKKLKNLWGDLGVAVHNFEIWKTIRLFDYSEMCVGAKEEENVKVIAIEKLLFQKALAFNIPKYHKDVTLIVAKINESQKFKFSAIEKENDLITEGINDLQYVEKTGPKILTLPVNI